MVNVEQLCEHCYERSAHFQSAVQFMTAEYLVQLCVECEELLRLEPGEYITVTSAHLKF